MQIPHITDAESAILESLWRRGPLSPVRLIAEVKTGRDWGDATLKTLIARLMHKGALKSRRDETGLSYHPLIERDAYAEAEIRSLVRRLFDNDPEAFKAFVEDRLKP